MSNKKITIKELKKMYFKGEREYLTSNIFYEIGDIQEESSLCNLIKIEVDLCFLICPLSNIEYNFDKAISVFISRVIKSNKVIDMSMRIIKDVNNPIKVEVSLEVLK